MQHVKAAPDVVENRRADLIECDRCHYDFDPDSSPNLILCWRCDEDAAIEAGELW